MRGVLVAAGLCACNQVYDLDQTRLAPPDAPHACPPIGAPAPVFSKLIFQASRQRFTSYHFNATGTLAVAADYSGGIFVGRFGEPLTRSLDIVPTGAYTFVDPHPTPAGDRLYIRAEPEVLFTAARTSGVAVYERDGDAWRFQEDLPSEITLKGQPSTVFRGPTGDRMLFVGSSLVEEVEHDGTTWITHGAHPRDAMLVAPYTVIALTSDGLRAVYRDVDNVTMLYTDRPDLESWFRAPMPLAGVPKVFDAQLTDDCARIYYSGFNTTFYSQQQ